VNDQNLKPFKKNDIRINRNGRPKSFDKLRLLAQQIANEPARDKEKNVIIKDGKIITQIEAMFRIMIQDPKRSALFLEYAYGRPKLELEHSGETSVTLRVKYDDGINGTPETATPQAD
jgi:hypothetical protein